MSVCLSVCLSLAGSGEGTIMTLNSNKHQCQANYVLKTDFCVIFLQLSTPHSLCFDVRDRHQREAGKSAIGLNVARFLKN